MAFVFPEGFDPQPHLAGKTVSLSPMQGTDWEELKNAASDPGIWAGHPAQNRHEAEVFEPYFNMLLDSGAALVIRDAARDIIGCSVYYTDTNAPVRLSIGFTFLTRNHWGGATNRQVKSLMLGHLFKSASEAWFHIAPTNVRSQVATQRLGAVFTHDASIDLAGGAQPWRCYCLTKEAWSGVARS